MAAWHMSDYHSPQVFIYQTKYLVMFKRLKNENVLKIAWFVKKMEKKKVEWVSR